MLFVSTTQDLRNPVSLFQNQEEDIIIRGVPDPLS